MNNKQFLDRFKINLSISVISLIVAIVVLIIVLSSCSTTGYTGSSTSKYYYNVSTGEQGVYTDRDNMVIKYNLTEGKTEIILK